VYVLTIPIISLVRSILISVVDERIRSFRVGHQVQHRYYGTPYINKALIYCAHTGFRACTKSSATSQVVGPTHTVNIGQQTLHVYPLYGTWIDFFTDVARYYDQGRVWAACYVQYCVRT